MRYTPTFRVQQQLLRYIRDRGLGTDAPLPTIVSLAKTLGVSKNTVQKAVHALSAEGAIEAKRGKGLFVKSIVRRARKSTRVALIYPNRPEYIKQSPYPTEVVRSLSQDLDKSGFSLDTHSLMQVERLTFVEHFRSLQPAGLVLFELDNDLLISELLELRLPMVSIDYDAYRLGISSVVFDNLYGAFQSTRHLIEMGHRYVVFMRPLLRGRFGINQWLNTVEDERMQGYRLAMLDAGLEPVTVEYEIAPDVLPETLLNLLGRRPAPTAFVCVADWSANRIIERASALGYRIPEDLSVIGFGDGSVEFAPKRRISSVSVDRKGMGSHAARLLLETMQGGRAAPERVVLPTSLLPRDSVARTKTEIREAR